MINPCSVIYFPGTGGNFLSLWLALNITPKLDHALAMYQGWYQFRVKPFI
jgi:hypothetical protein